MLPLQTFEDKGIMKWVMLLWYQLVEYQVAKKCQKCYRACLVDQVMYYYSGPQLAKPYERVAITTPTKLMLNQPSAYFFCSISSTCDISSDDAYSSWKCFQSLVLWLKPGIEILKN